MMRQIKNRVAISILSAIVSIGFVSGCSKKNDVTATGTDGQDSSAQTDRRDSSGQTEFAKPDLLATYDASFWPVEFSHDGKCVAFCAESPNESIVTIADVVSGKVRTTLKMPGKHDTEAIAFSRDDKLVAIAWNKDLLIWDVATGLQKQVVKAWGFDVSRLQFSLDGKELMAAGERIVFSTELRVWDIDSAKELVRISDSISGSGAFSADGKIAVIFASGADGDGSVRVWDIHEKKIVRTHRLPPVKLSNGPNIVGGSIRFGADRKLLAMNRLDYESKLWDVESGLLLAEFHAQSPRFSCTAMSPDGSWFVETFRDGAASIWNVPTGKRQSNFRAHDGSVRFVEFDENSRFLVTWGGQDRHYKLKLWKLPAKQP